MIHRFGIFEFDTETGVLRKDGRPVPLERQPARVLSMLVAHAGELVTREQLRESVWGRDTHVDVDRGLAYCLSQIRAALRDRSDNPRFIRTLPKRGYTFIAPVAIEAPRAHGVEPSELAPASRAPATEAGSGHPARTRHWRTAAAAAALLLVLAGWSLSNSRGERILIAVSIFDNETGLTEYDRPIQTLSDVVVADLSALAPDRIAVIGNAAALRRPRNIRNLETVAESVRADYVLLGQLQQGNQGLRFITHVIRLRDLAHLKANRIHLSADGIGSLEAAVTGEFARAVREHLLTGHGN